MAIIGRAVAQTGNGLPILLGVAPADLVTYPGMESSSGTRRWSRTIRISCSRRAPSGEARRHCSCSSWGRWPTAHRSSPFSSAAGRSPRRRLWRPSAESGRSWSSRGPAGSRTRLRSSSVDETGADRRPRPGRDRRLPFGPSLRRRDLDRPRPRPCLGAPGRADAQAHMAHVRGLRRNRQQREGDLHAVPGSDLVLGIGGPSSRCSPTPPSSVRGARTLCTGRWSPCRSFSPPDRARRAPRVREAMGPPPGSLRSGQERDLPISEPHRHLRGRRFRENRSGARRDARPSPERRRREAAQHRSEQLAADAVRRPATSEDVRRERRPTMVSARWTPTSTSSCGWGTSSTTTTPRSPASLTGCGPSRCSRSPLVRSGALLAAAGFEVWIGLTTAIAASIVAYLGFLQVEPTLVAYNQAAAGSRRFAALGRRSRMRSTTSRGSSPTAKACWQLSYRAGYSR